MAYVETVQNTDLREPAVSLGMKLLSDLIGIESSNRRVHMQHFHSDQFLFQLFAPMQTKLELRDERQQVCLSSSVQTVRTHQISSDEGSDEEAHVHVDGMAAMLSDLSQTR